jgi:hypothetical protein
MSETLLELMDELLQAIEQRDAGDPDAPAWEATARIKVLEEELARRLSAGEGDRLSLQVAGAPARERREAAAALA